MIGLYILAFLIGAILVLLVSIWPDVKRGPKVIKRTGWLNWTWMEK